MPYPLSQSIISCQSQILNPHKIMLFESRNDPSPKSEVEHETKFSLKIFYSTHVWVVEWNRHLPSNPLAASVVSLVPTGCDRHNIERKNTRIDLLDVIK